MPSRRVGRTVAVAILLICVFSLATSYTAASSGEYPVADGTPVPTDGAVGVEEQINRSNVSTSPVAEADTVTVVATQGFYVSDEEAELVAFDASGNVLYHDNTYRVYFDVDPVPDEQYTVEYVAAKHLNGQDCAEFEAFHCTRNIVERVNLSTGDRTQVYAELTPRVYSARWHDTDRVNETHLAVADIIHDRVYVVDIRTGRISWQWNASSHYSKNQGGKEGDWTHINDVEALHDGRFMVSMRNMDEVLFIEPGQGVNTSWTVGQDDDHSILYEQHNPDYIPASNGGPAVTVGDSENNRIQEFQRVGGEWESVWTWRDARLQWPRDADRLPNGHTLVVDSHGDRVLELDRNGSIVWNVTIGMPYDAERLGTSDGSTGGPSWTQIHGDGGGGVGSPSAVDRAVLLIKDLLPSLVVNGLLYVSPSWVRFMDLLVAALLVVDLFTWGALEFYWSSLSVRGLVGRLMAAVRSVP